MILGPATNSPIFQAIIDIIIPFDESIYAPPTTLVTIMKFIACMHVHIGTHCTPMVLILLGIRLFWVDLLGKVTFLHWRRIDAIHG